MNFTEVYGDTVSSVALAARSGCRKQVRRLIQRGGSVDCRDNRGWNSLHEAAAAGNEGCVREILKAAARSSRSFRAFVNSLTHEGESSCYLAAQRGHMDVVRLLLKNHAVVNQQTNDLSCPLYAAVDAGHVEVVRLLVREGAEVNGTHTASCWTCLHQAVYKGHSDIVRILVSVSDLEAVDDHNITPLFVAAQYGRHDDLQTLAFADANVDAQAADGATPLMIASQEGHESCVDFLLGCGANPNTPCSSEWPQLPIHAAAQFGRISVLRRLIAATDRGCDRGRGQVSPLYLAIHNNQRTSVELLLKEGFSPDAQDCWELLGLRSPLLVSAGASLIQDHWDQVLAADRTDLLRLILDLRRIPHLDLAPCHRPEAWGPAVLTLPELKHLLSAAVTQVDAAARWLPLLLNAGLDPHLLLLDGLDGAVLNYLLQFVNWSTLSLDLKLVLDRRQAEKTWSPLPQFDSLPSLFHLCRMRIRTLLGPDLLMRTAVVQQLPLPSPLHAVLLTAHLI
uniref:Ankyrin repeat and SOCS box containing 3 n=1 Tax=Sphaeramia orbicularis TaxID=375764 RepID=A0A673C6N7_9TELE